MTKSIPGKKTLIARNSQRDSFLSLLNRSSAQLIAVTGRRRIGKTYLVRNSIEEKAQFLEIVGKRQSSRDDLKDNFLSSIEEHLDPVGRLSRELSWREIFQIITKTVSSSKHSFVLFLDEFPWMCMADSEFLPAFEHIWNSKWSQLAKIKVIICGSATSWMREKIFSNTGGLYNRITGRLELAPFSIHQCAEFVAAKQLNLPDEALLEYYLALGGIPFYWDLIGKGEPSSEFIQRAIFSSSGVLRGEFSIMLEAIFRRSSAYKKVVSALAKSRYGLSRPELAKASGVAQGGTLERVLTELSDCSFITKYVPFGYSEKGMYFRLADEFMLFHSFWLHRLKETGLNQDPQYWLKQLGTGRYANWSGASFEIFCQRHIQSILMALGISGIKTELSTWRTPAESKEEKIQVDLVIDRADGIVTLVECKRSQLPLALTSKEIARYAETAAIFKEQTKTSKIVNSVLISATPIRNAPALSSTFYRSITFAELLRYPQEF